MAIKFSSCGLFRAEVRHFMDGWSHATVEDALKLQLENMLAEMRGLAVQGVIVDPEERLVGPNVDLPVHAFLTENNVDPERTAELMYKIHGLINPYFVQSALYRWMGRALEELDINDIHPDLAKVIDVARAEYQPENFCPRAILTQ